MSCSNRLTLFQHADIILKSEVQMRPSDLKLYFTGNNHLFNCCILFVLFLNIFPQINLLSSTRLEKIKGPT